MAALKNNCELFTQDEDTILTGRIDLLLHHMPNAIGASLLSYLLLGYWLFEKNGSLIFPSLCACMFLLTAIGAITLINFSQTETSTINSETRNAALIAYCAMCGALWGALGYVGISASNASDVLVILIALTGITASAIASLASLPRAFYCFVIPTITPIAVQLIPHTSDAYTFVGISVIVCLCVNILLSHRIRGAVLKTIVLSVENSTLIGNLTQEKINANIARAAADQSNSAKSKFLAAASHDLRQPLQALRLLTTTLDAKMQQPDQKQIVVNINRSLQSLEGLFNSLLDISKLDAGTVQVEIEHFNMQTFINRINHDCRVLAQNKGLVFESQNCDHVVATDRFLLERVIRNLTNNAIRYTTSGMVTMSFTSDPIRIYLTIEDTGCGIHSADITRVFDEFVQLKNQERDRARGLGLGLSIVKRICKLLQITLHLDSVPDRGTRVTIGIPRGDISRVTMHRSQLLQIDSSLDQLFVVIVEDDEDVRIALSGLLSTWKCHVVSAVSGDEMIRKLEQYEYHPDVIIADYRLRDNLTGADAITAIEEHCGLTIPAVIITADVGTDRLQEIAVHGYPVLHKPCEPSILAALLTGIARKTSDS